LLKPRDYKDKHWIQKVLKEYRVKVEQTHQIREDFNMEQRFTYIDISHHFKC